MLTSVSGFTVRWKKKTEARKDNVAASLQPLVWLAQDDATCIVVLRRKEPNPI